MTGWGPKPLWLTNQETFSFRSCVRAHLQTSKAPRTCRVLGGGSRMDAHELHVKIEKKKHTHTQSLQKFAFKKNVKKTPCVFFVHSKNLQKSTGHCSFQKSPRIHLPFHIFYVSMRSRTLKIYISPGAFFWFIPKISKNRPTPPRLLCFNAFKNIKY